MALSCVVCFDDCFRVCRGWFSGFRFLGCGVVGEAWRFGLVIGCMCLPYVLIWCLCLKYLLSVWLACEGLLIGFFWSLLLVYGF